VLASLPAMPVVTSVDAATGWLKTMEAA